MSVNERTFQGELYRIINNLLVENENIMFSKITQEENVGVGEARFADGKIYSRADTSKIVSVELKNAKWDATDEVLVTDAMHKAANNGYEYFVTGTPRQLVIYKTFKANTTINDRKLKIYYLSNIKKDDEILLPHYEKQVTPKLKEFLLDLSDLVHEVKEIHWDSIDKYFVNKLSAFILEASAEMFSPMFKIISNDSVFRNKLKDYLKGQEIFNVSTNFTSQDIYKICQLANYLLYLKIMFYSYLQRDVPELHLKPLEIPEDKDLLNKTLHERFDDVLKHDFEMIFSKSILDEFEFEAKYIPELKSNVEEIKQLDFSELTADIIGAIYNTLIDNQEQHDRGQHFTNTNEVDIVIAFCVNEKTGFILDSGCGAGTFLVRGYYFLKYFHPELTHEQLLERLWGIDIAPFPVFLSTMNLSLLNIKSYDNYPVIINSDFAKVSSNKFFHMYFLNANNLFKVKNIGKKEADVQIPHFDVCVGNPPYIRQEMIEDKEEWNQLTKIEWGLKKINQQSDFYVYYLMHTAAFLKEGCRLGYVISSSWLDVAFGSGFQKFMLNHFKIIAVIDHQKKRSFETASINTVILIIEKCSNRTLREINNVRFIRVYSSYEKLIGSSSDKNRAGKVIDFVKKIEGTNNTVKTSDNYITVINQNNLERDSTFDGKYENGHWGAKYLRSPEILTKILSNSKDKLIPLSKVVDVEYGIKTGANDFFYVADETEKIKTLPPKEYKLIFGVDKAKHINVWDKFGWYFSEMNNQHYMLERFYLKPLFKTQREAKNLEVDITLLKNFVLVCSDEKNKLGKFKNKVLKYIQDAELLDLDKRPSVSHRNNWYDLSGDSSVGDFIYPTKIGEKYRLIDNRESKVYCDKVNYVIKVKKKYEEYTNEIFLILNSITFRYFVDLFSRQLTGNQTLSDVDVNVVEKTLIVNPELLKDKKKELSEIYKLLKSREQGTISQEIKRNDKKQLDTIIFSVLGLSEKDVDELYREAAKYVSDRAEKSASVKTSKTKQKLSYDSALALVKERFTEIESLKDLIGDTKFKTINVPEWKAIFPKVGLGVENLFGTYYVNFKEGNKQQNIAFENPQQLKLFHYLNTELDVKGQKINIPVDAKICEKIFLIIKRQFEKYSPVIKNFLKANRAQANYLSIYRDVVLEK